MNRLLAIIISVGLCRKLWTSRRRPLGRKAFPIVPSRSSCRYPPGGPSDTVARVSTHKVLAAKLGGKS